VSGVLLLSGSELWPHLVCSSPIDEDEKSEEEGEKGREGGGENSRQRNREKKREGEREKDERDDHMILIHYTD
jgi:hypothetical protein